MEPSIRDATASTSHSLIASDQPPVDDFVLSDEERTAIEHEKGHFENPRAASIEALKIVQKSRGWVADGAIYAISDVLGIPSSDVEGVATFYSLIFRQPVGRHVILICDSSSCFLTDYEQLRDAFTRELGIGLGQTTPDNRFTMLPVCCLGACDRGPALMIDNDLHGPVAPEDIASLLEHYA